MYPQCQSVIPACGEVPYFDLIVACCLPLTPQQETLLCTKTLLVDVADGESQNKGPYQAQYNLAVAINHILSTDIGHLDPPTPDVIE